MESCGHHMWSISCKASYGNLAKGCSFIYKNAYTLLIYKETDQKEAAESYLKFRKKDILVERNFKGSFSSLIKYKQNMKH